MNIIPSVHLALAAARLAANRVGRPLSQSIGYDDGRIIPVPRKTLMPDLSPVSAEYYAIIDRITRGEAV